MSSQINKPPELVDWLAPPEQQLWFDQFSQLDEETKLTGLRFQHFHKLLKAALYCHFKRAPPPSDPPQAGRSDDRVAQNETSQLEADMSKLTIRQDGTQPPDQQEGEMFTKQQEMLLFRKFDHNNDHLLDRDEFGQLCQKWLHRVFQPSCALVVVDVQNDFIDGSLALINGPAGQDGAEVVPVINELVAVCQRYQTTIVYTQDWHPQDHVSFHANLHLRKYTTLAGESSGGGSSSSNQGRTKESKQPGNSDSEEDTEKDELRTIGPNGSSSQEDRFKYKRFAASQVKLFDTVLFDEGRVEQTLWPTHCVHHSWGAQLHPKLRVAPDSIRVQKGTLSHVDAYSAFWDNMRQNETGLRQELVGKRVTELFLCGLALDYCVAASALDATKAGFVTFVVEDACRGIDLREIERRKQELRDHGAFIVNSDFVSSYLQRHANNTETRLDGGSDSSAKLSRDLIKAIAYRKAFC